MSTPSPLSGHLVPLRTVEEVRASLETDEVYVAELPSKHTNDIKDALQAALPDFKMSEINHLRRVCQFKYLPERLQQEYAPPTRLAKGVEDNEFGPIFLSSSPAPPPSVPSDFASPVEQDSENLIKYLDLVRFMVLCPTRYLTQDKLLDIIRKREPYNSNTALPRIFRATVPALSPISAQQAEEWSNQYWPIAYKNNNPYGPHPSLVQRSQDEIQPSAGEYLALARIAGQQISDRCLGEDVGVVIIDQSKPKPDNVIAVAGDCRWRFDTGDVEPHTGNGNPMAHAALRAIAMVAKKRLRAGGKEDDTNIDRPFFCDIPITSVEKEHYEKDNINATGYLCVDLDIYLTNEPCVMCSMAILHSRFKRCVFGKRMPHTGSMTSDEPSDLSSGATGLKNGLFWRPNKLNWKLLTYEFKEDDKPADARAGLEDTLHA